MLPEISLNILDIAQNSVRANSSLVEISLKIDTAADTLTVIIKDDGCGMNEQQVKNVIDPFFTTRKTRKIGLGVPFYKMAAESTGGSFDIQSKPGVGTVVTAVFILSSIDRMPIGDMTFAVHTLITLNTNMDFLYSYYVDDKGFVLDTRQFKEILGGVALDAPDVSQYIKDYLNENSAEVNDGRIF